MKRRRTVTFWGMPLLLSFLIKDVLIVGWELNNVTALLVILFFLYLMFVLNR